MPDLFPKSAPVPTNDLQCKPTNLPLLSPSSTATQLTFVLDTHLPSRPGFQTLSREASVPLGSSPASGRRMTKPGTRMVQSARTVPRARYAADHNNRIAQVVKCADKIPENFGSIPACADIFQSNALYRALRRPRGRESREIPVMSSN